mmetsp:Transcript_8074/g.20946  ORF Transcript_8074/g.20946 Transcript_8074/m.20946 type:complete len:240 (+) Transcript_8074:2-721(+)
MKLEQIERLVRVRDDGQVDAQADGPPRRRRRLTPPSSTPATPPITPLAPSTPSTSAPGADLGFPPLVVPVPSDPSTWVEDPPTLPTFATHYEHPKTINTPAKLAQEWFDGINDGPPVRSLEIFYGPGQRNGWGQPPRCSWRAAATRGDKRKFEKAFSKRHKLYKFFETHKDDRAGAIARLDLLIKRRFPDDASPSTSHIVYLRDNAGSALDEPLGAALDDPAATEAGTGGAPPAGVVHG